jgi:hypothetical protein
MNANFLMVPIGRFSKECIGGKYSRNAWMTGRSCQSRSDEFNQKCKITTGS